MKNLLIAFIVICIGAGGLLVYNEYNKNQNNIEGDAVIGNNNQSQEENELNIEQEDNKL